MPELAKPERASHSEAMAMELRPVKRLKRKSSFLRALVAFRRVVLTFRSSHPIHARAGSVGRRFVANEKE